MRFTWLLGAVVAVALTITGAWFVTPSIAQLGSASPVSTTVSVGTASVQVLPANASRHGVIFYNQSAYVISILPGTGTAVASAGGTINLPASGGMLSLSCWNTYPCGNAFQAISTNAASALTLWEF